MKKTVISIAAGLMMALPAQAAVIQAVDTLRAQVSVDGAQQIDSNTGPFATANLVQIFGGPLPDTYTANAFQRDNGFSQIEAKVSHSGFEGIAANGDPTEHRGQALAVRRVTYTNTSATTAFAGLFNYTLRDMYLEVFNGGGGPTIPQAELFFVISTSNGINDVSSATLTNDSGNPVLDATGGFGGTLNKTDCFGTRCQGGNVTLDNTVGSLNLGFLAPGESMTVETALAASIRWNGTEIGAIARAIDPNGSTSFSATFTPVETPAPVPLPASGLMLLAALAGAVGLRQRAKSRGTG